MQLLRCPLFLRNWIGRACQMLRFIACENSVLSTLAFVPTSRYTILAHTLRHLTAELYRLVQGLEIGVINCTRNCLDVAQKGSMVQHHKAPACEPLFSISRLPAPLASLAHRKYWFPFLLAPLRCDSLGKSTPPALQDVPEHYAPL